MVVLSFNMLSEDRKYVCLPHCPTHQAGRNRKEEERGDWQEEGGERVMGSMQRILILERSLPISNRLSKRVAYLVTRQLWSGNGDERTFVPSGEEGRRSREGKGGFRK